MSAKTNAGDVAVFGIFVALTVLVSVATVFMLLTGNKFWWFGIFSVVMGITYSIGYAKDAIR